LPEQFDPASHVGLLQFPPAQSNVHVDPDLHVTTGQRAPPPVHLNWQVAPASQVAVSAVQFPVPSLQSYVHVDPLAHAAVPLQVVPPLAQFTLQLDPGSQVIRSQCPLSLQANEQCEPAAQCVRGQVAPPPVQRMLQVAAAAHSTSTPEQLLGPPALQS
jgi:hypothetical protein